MLGYCSETKHPYIICEFVNGQVLKDFIKHAGTQLLWPHRVKVVSIIMRTATSRITYTSQKWYLSNDKQNSTLDATLIISFYETHSRNVIKLAGDCLDSISSTHVIIFYIKWQLHDVRDYIRLSPNKSKRNPLKQLLNRK